MDEICGLKFHLSYVDMPQDFFLEIPQCAHISGLKMKSGLEKIFLKSLHPKKILWHIYIMINETLSHKFHPYSILTGEVTVKWLKY